MTALKERIAALISAAGPISVADYFALCLSDPQHGYYMTPGSVRARRAISRPPRRSARCSANWSASGWSAAWRALGQPARPVIAEIGPGRGTLAKDIVRTLEKIEPALLASAHFALIETSPRLRGVQAATLQDCGVDVAWHDHLG